MTYRKRVGPGIYKSLKTGRYSIRYKVGREVVDRGGYRTLEAARTARTRALADASRGIKARPKRVTVDQWYDEWWPRYSQRVKPGTAKTNGGNMRRHVLPKWGRTPLDELSPRALQRWVDELATVIPANVVHVQSVFSVMLQDAVRYEVLFRNPMRLVTAPAYTPPPRSTLSHDELRRYLAVAPAPLAWVALTGARISEVRGMRWRNVIGDTWVIDDAWSQTVAVGPTGTKNSHSVRSVPVTALMRDLLPERGAPADFVWGRHGHSWFHRRHREALAAIGVRGVTIHDLRHTWATLALGESVHPKLVQQQLGHSKLATTMDTYSSVLPELTRNAAESVESAILRPSGEGIVGGIAGPTGP